MLTDDELKDNFRDYLLYFSVLSNNEKYAQQLIESGANINRQDEHGDTPLHIAYRNEFWDIVNLLLRHNAKMFIKNNNGYVASDYFYEDLSSSNLESFNE